MQVELDAGAVSLNPNQTLRLRDAVGTTVCAVDGAAWMDMPSGLAMAGIMRRKPQPRRRVR